MKDDCLFCKIAQKKVPALILYEDEDLMVLLDAYPNTDGHTLVIPKKHYEDIYEIPADMLSKITERGKIEAKKIMQKMNKKALTFLINYGDAQAIKHLHLHLLPNFGENSHKLKKEEVYEILMKD